MKVSACDGRYTRSHDSEDKVEAQLQRVKQDDFPTIYKNLCAKQKAIELKRQELYTQKVT